MEDNSLFVFLFALMLVCYAFFSGVNLFQYYKKKRQHGVGEHMAIIHIRASLANFIFCGWYFLIICYAASSYIGDTDFWNDIKIDWIFYAPFVLCVLLIVFKRVRSSPFTSIALVILPIVGYCIYIYVSNN